MTREEALQILDTIPTIGEQVDALEMAISALEQQPCDDEYIKVPKKALKYRTAGMVAYNTEWLKKHWQMEMDIVCGVKPCKDAVSRGVLEQVMWERDIAIEQLHELGYELGQKIEPCEDAVSRRKAIHVISACDGKSAQIEALEQLPSVTQKSGEWIELPKALNPNENPCKCSECGHILSFMNCYPKSNYCPNCGADMRGAE